MFHNLKKSKFKNVHNFYKKKEKNRKTKTGIKIQNQEPTKKPEKKTKKKRKKNRRRTTG
jgi:hypothetical protein